MTSSNRVPISVSSKAKELNLKGWYDDDHRGSASKLRRSMYGKRRGNFKFTLRDHRQGR